MRQGNCTPVSYVMDEIVGGTFEPLLASFSGAADAAKGRALSLGECVWVHRMGPGWLTATASERHETGLNRGPRRASGRPAAAVVKTEDDVYREYYCEGCNSLTCRCEPAPGDSVPEAIALAG